LSISFWPLNVVFTADFDPDFAKVLEERGYIPDDTRITIADVKNIGTLDVDGTYENWKAGKVFFQ